MSLPHALVILMLAGADGGDVDALLARAEHAYANLEYEAARDIVLDVVAGGKASHAQLRRAHMLGGEVDRILGRDVDARMHFLWVLQRDPGARLPEGRPPKISAFFEMVRGEVQGAAPPPPPPPPPAPVPVPTAPPPASPTASPTTTAAPAAAGETAGKALPAPAWVAAGAGVVAVGALSCAVFGEATFARTAASWDERSGGQALATVGWTAAALSTATAGAALLWWSTGP